MSEKEVYFNQYCYRCQYANYTETAEPCDECIAQSVNEDSHKPLYFKQAKKSSKTKPTDGCVVQKAPKNEWTYRSKS